MADGRQMSGSSTRTGHAERKLFAEAEAPAALVRVGAGVVSDGGNASTRGLVSPTPGPIARASRGFRDRFAVS
jgi:hypothetical protein